MPTYAYHCPTCGRFETTHHMTERLENCPTCKGPVRRIPQAIGWTAKCSGFYRTDKVLSDKSIDED